MTATELYVIRHGRTMFNALQRAQGCLLYTSDAADD